MFLVKICRHCDKHIITRNDGTVKDKNNNEVFEKAKMICECL